MNVIHLRPIGWNETTPRQWGILRDLIREVSKVAVFRCHVNLYVQAEKFLIKTEGRDV